MKYIISVGALMLVNSVSATGILVDDVSTNIEPSEQPTAYDFIPSNGTSLVVNYSKRNSYSSPENAEEVQYTVTSTQDSVTFGNNKFTIIDNMIVPTIHEYGSEILHYEYEVISKSDKVTLFKVKSSYGETGLIGLIKVTYNGLTDLNIVGAVCGSYSYDTVVTMSAEYIAKEMIFCNDTGVALLAGKNINLFRL